MLSHAFPLLPGINCTFPQLHDCEDMGKPLVCSKQQVKPFYNQNSDKKKNKQNCDFESMFSNILMISFMLYLLTLFSI